VATTSSIPTQTIHYFIINQRLPTLQQKEYSAGNQITTFKLSVHNPEHELQEHNVLVVVADASHSWGRVRRTSTCNVTATSSVGHVPTFGIAVSVGITYFLLFFYQRIYWVSLSGFSLAHSIVHNVHKMYKEVQDDQKFSVHLMIIYLLHEAQSFLRSWPVFITSKEIPRIFVTRKFFTVLTSACYPSLSWSNSIQSTRPHPASWRSNIYYPPIYVWVSPMTSFPQVSPPTHSAPSLLLHTRHMSQLMIRAQKNQQLI
jgi:hypothetical protein